MPRASRARGLTLLETLLAATLAALLLTLFIQVLVPMARGTVGVTDQGQLESMALVIMEKLQNDMQASSAAGLSAHQVAGKSQALAIHPLAGVDDQGRQVWIDHLIVWWWNATDQVVYRREWPPAPPTLAWAVTTDVPVRVKPADFASLAVQAAGCRSLGIAVQEFALSGIQESGQVTPPITVHLRLERPSTRASGTARIVLDRTIYLPNAASTTRQEKPP